MPAAFTPRYYSASSTCQDRWVIETVFAGRREGYFVDIGATDGIGASNTCVLEREFGWRGICVEPNTSRFTQLRANRHCICENVCIYDRAGIVQFTEPAAFPGYGGITRHLAAHKKKWWGVGAREVAKNAITLADLLARHAAPRVIEYLSLDVEGCEYEILKSFPFDTYTFLAVTVEGASCDALLTVHGYRRVSSPFCTVDWEHFFLYDAVPGG